MIKYDIGVICNGILTGLVASTSCCHNIDVYTGVFIGSISGLVYFYSQKILLIFKIDDPVQSSCVHGFGGLWGIFVPGFFDL